MVAQTRHLTLGAAGEAAAEAFLQRLGWRIETKNWRPAGSLRGLELDIIAWDKKELVFVEVKTRARKDRAGAQEKVPAHASFTPTKQGRLLRAAQCYLSAGDLWDQPCRFDLICAEQGPLGDFSLEHHSNVIEVGNLVGGRNAAWQPW